MRTTRVVVGSESGKGASMMMSKGTYVAEKTRQMKADGDVSGMTLPFVANMTSGTVGTNSKIPKLVLPDDPKDLALGPSDHQVSQQVNSRRRDNRFKNTTPVVIDDEVDDWQQSQTSPLPIQRVDENVYIGNKIGAENIVYLKNNGITHILNTAAEIPNYHEATTKLSYFKLQLTDDPRPHVDNLLKILEPSYKFITTAITSNPKSKIFVHCAAGISRSASIVTYYLMKRNSIGLNTALNFLRTKRNCVNPNPWYISQLQDSQTIIEHETGKLL